MLPPPTSVDLFCGAGGLSLGLKQAGYDVLLASDFNAVAGQTYAHNLGTERFRLADIHALDPRDLLDRIGLGVGELDLLAGGPPCQGFSIIGARHEQDPRNSLFREYLRIAGALRPRAIVMENVPGLRTLVGGAVLRDMFDGFDAAGYRVACAELVAAQYGVPQLRWRLVFIAFRKDIDVPPGYGFPRPTHGSTAIGELVPNRTLLAHELKGLLTARDAIGDLPRVASGESNNVYDGKPTRPYHVTMRKGLKAELYNHYAPKLSEQNLTRIRHLRAGQDWRDLPTELLPLGMRRALRKDHTRRFSRMTWNGVPRSIITRFRDPKSGEYTHPTQHRTITLREAARIQSFPDWFEFRGAVSDIYDQIGNAVPPLLGQAVGTEIAACLSGKPRAERLDVSQKGRLGRRTALSRSSLLFDAL